MKCETCNNEYYINSFNTKTEKQEIQKCDDCNIYKSDEEIQKILILRELEEKFLKPIRRMNNVNNI